MSYTVKAHWAGYFEGEFDTFQEAKEASDALCAEHEGAAAYVEGPGLTATIIAVQDEVHA